jgi:hypothetical protein
MTVPPLHYPATTILSKLTNLDGQLSEASEFKTLQLLKPNTLFCDPIFKPERKSIGEKLVLSNVEWRRPREFLKDEPVLYEGEVEAFNLKQGKL